MLRIDTHCLTPALSFRSDMDRLFSDVFGNENESSPSISGRRGHPALDVWEEDDTYFVSIDVPGLSEGDFQITALGRELSLVGGAVTEEAQATEEDQPSIPRDYFYRERCALSFERTIRFPFEIDAAHVQGSLQAGVLNIRVPKAASAKPQTIEIKTR
ncbi:MAG: Hsp20/alpha crystallin family protein [Pirellulales bacterium]|nr:Hsp20/alpha crystallin family protein [Pirellulales bacterium]